MLGLALTPFATRAQTWPGKPVRVVIGAPSGGTVDIVARLLAEGLQKEWGQPVFVEAKRGGAGTIGVNELMMAPADGHTLYLALNATVTEIPHVVKVSYASYSAGTISHTMGLELNKVAGIAMSSRRSRRDCSNSAATRAAAPRPKK